MHLEDKLRWKVDCSLRKKLLFYQPTSFPNISKSPIIYKKNHHPGCPQCGLPTTDKNKRKTKGCCRRKEVEAQACPDSLTSSKCVFYEDDADDDHAIVDTNCQRLNHHPLSFFNCQLTVSSGPHLPDDPGSCPDYIAPPHPPTSPRHTPDLHTLHPGHSHFTVKSFSTLNPLLEIWWMERIVKVLIKFEESKSIQ